MSIRRTSERQSGLKIPISDFLIKNPVNLNPIVY